MEMLPKNPISATVDFDRKGIQHGHLRLPSSRDESAWGNIMIPITVIANGDGPTALLTGGNHGDEYEGPIALKELAIETPLEDVSGRIIIVPAMNAPAFEVARRNSPFDNSNLNRSFPGQPTGMPTNKIADYFTRTLLPMADYVLDFHSGGRTLDFLPFAACHELDDKTQEKAARDAVAAFGAPYSMVMIEMDPAGLYDTEAERQGKVFVTTELGGGGTATPWTIGIARRGVRNVLKHAGILAGEIETAKSEALIMPDDCFVVAEDGGVASYRAELGAVLSKGDPILDIWPMGKTGVAPTTLTAPLDGIFLARHVAGLIRPGDCAAVLAVRDEGIGA